MLLRPNLETKALFIGKSGCGKTTLDKSYQEKYYPRRVVVDTKGHDYSSKDGVIVKSIQDFNEKLREYYVNKTESFVLIYQFGLGYDQEQMEEQFEKICELVIKFRGILFVVEEVQNYCSTHRILRWFRTILLQGRSYKIALVMTTPKLSMIHNSLPDMCDYLFIGTCRGVLERRFLADTCGVSFNEFEVLPYFTFYIFDGANLEKITKEKI